MPECSMKELMKRQACIPEMNDIAEEVLANQEAEKWQAGNPFEESRHPLAEQRGDLPVELYKTARNAGITRGGGRRSGNHLTCRTTPPKNRKSCGKTIGIVEVRGRPIDSHPCGASNKSFMECEWNFHPTKTLQRVCRTRL